MAKSKTAAKKVSAKHAGAVHKVSPAKPVVVANPVATGNPVFAEPGFMNDPSVYSTKYTTQDSVIYKELDKLKKNPLPFRTVAGVVEPVLTLAAAYGSAGAKVEQAITTAQQIVFHSAGDTGDKSYSTNDEYDVIDKLISDFDEKDPAAVPQFFYHLGDIVYSFGEHQYYYDQFYDAFRNYPAPIFAIPGNHDGVVIPVAPVDASASPTPGDPNLSLSAFYSNFCTPTFQTSADAVGLSRTTMIQPGVYFTLECPLVRILGLYSNMLESPGVISSAKNPTKNNAPTYPQLTDVQLDYLQAALTRVKTDGFKGAVIIAVHHPPYTFGKHPSSIVMLKEMDAVCASVGVWPHAVLSGHAHNYQRYTRTINGRQIPYVVCGNGGHPPLQKLTVDTTLRTPIPMPGFAQADLKDSVTLDNYDFLSFGYLRVIVDPTQLRIEFHPEGDGVTTKTPDDFVTVSLADDKTNGTLIHYVAPTTALQSQIQKTAKKK